MDLSKLSDADLQALASNDLARVSDAGLAALTGKATKYDDTAFRDAMSPTADMNTGERLLAGAGKSVSDTVLGIRQMLGRASHGEVAEAARLDKPLMDTGAGVIGNVAGQVAQMAIPGGQVGRLPMLARATAAAPRLAPIAGAAAQGGAFAATQPVQEGETRAGNIGVGAALGAAGEGLAQGVGAVARRAKEAISPEVRALYEKAQELGIPVNAAQLGDSKFIKTLQSTLERVPFTGGQASRDQQQAAFNRAVSQTFGENSDKVTREVYAQAKGRIGGEFERLSSQNQLGIDPVLAQRLGAISEEAKKFGAPESSNAVAAIIDDVMEKAKLTGDLPGKAYQSIDSQLGRLMKSGGEKSMYLGQVRDALREAMDQSISAADKEAWQTARRQYKNLKTVRDLVAKEGADGNISPSQLMGRVNSSQAGKEANAMGKGGDMTELARIGRQFVRDPIPDSGTAQRLGVLGLLGGAGGIGYNPQSGITFDPTNALLAVGGAATLGRGANAGINSKLASRYLLNGGARGLLSDAAQVSPYALPATGLLYLGQ